MERSLAILVNPPCVLFEDEHLLVVNKPPGMNTHAPGPYAGEGLHEWLQRREPRWAKLAIIHRLDKETSGVLVFSKTVAGNRSLVSQFTDRTVSKAYVFWSSRRGPAARIHVRGRLVRAGARYVTSTVQNSAAEAETLFEPGQEVERPIREPVGSRMDLIHEITARPRTGRTHQIRVQAADQGFPILGDQLYGGGPFGRLCLHARRLELNHPVTGERMNWEAPWDFTEPAWLSLRKALFCADETDAYRLVHGAADGFPGRHLDVLGPYLLWEGEERPEPRQISWVRPARPAEPGIYFKATTRHVRRIAPPSASPAWLEGPQAPTRFSIRENGLSFELSFEEGYSVGLFLDQRDNRRRWLTNYVAAGFEPFVGGAAGRTVLNTFAYTCAFSVAAARAGAHTTSLDLSKKYLDWGRRQFELNGMNPAGHDFIYGDAFDWMKRLGRKGRRFDAIILDPPTFSQSKQSGMFRAESDYGKLVRTALPLLEKGGTLFASSNASRLDPERFLESVRQAVQESGRRLEQVLYIPQPPDFPITKDEPAHLKTVWCRVA